jgi:hypothetical protein
MPWQLTDRLKQQCVDTCSVLLSQYEAKGDDFLDYMVIGNETWVNHVRPKSKRASKEWQHASLPKP